MAKIREKIFIFGASGHALFVHNILKMNQLYDIVAFVDTINCDRDGEEFDGKKIFAGENALSKIEEMGVKKFAFGFGNCSARMRIYDSLETSGFEIVSSIHPQSVIAEDARIGKGVVIGAGVVVDPGCIIGANCIINNNACICHGTHIGKGSHICPGVTIGGDVIVGEGCWIGIGSTIVEKIKIGSKSYLGAGSVLIRDLPESILAYGVPAKIRGHRPHDF